MSAQYDTFPGEPQDPAEICQYLIQHLETHLEPLVRRLDAYVDKRLVKTLVRAIAAMIMFRHPKQGLYVSELGAYITNGAQAPAGTKRLENLLLSEKWEGKLIEEYIWEEAEKKLREMERGEEQALCIWDGSVIEKPESEKIEGVSAVRSSKAKRLRMPRKGVVNDPRGKPVMVMGMEWIGVVVAGMAGAPTIAHMKWWTRKGKYASKGRNHEELLVRRVAREWGKKVWHIFDRAYGTGPWLDLLQRLGVLFVIRWKKGVNFLDHNGQEKKLWEIVRGKKSWGYKTIWDSRKHCERKTGIFAMPVRHAAYAGELWVVVVRQGGEPWYLISNVPVEIEEQAWKVMFAYARRWQIETVFRYGKSELAMESPRNWKWETRVKLLLMATLAYEFLLSLLDPAFESIRKWILKQYCHRTGKRYQKAKVPLYRLRWALSRFWQEYRPIFCFTVLTSAYYENIRFKNSG